MLEKYEFLSYVFKCLSPVKLKILYNMSKTCKNVTQINPSVQKTLKHIRDCISFHNYFSKLYISWLIHFFCDVLISIIFSLLFTKLLLILLILLSTTYFTPWRFAIEFYYWWWPLQIFYFTFDLVWTCIYTHPSSFAKHFIHLSSISIFFFSKEDYKMVTLMLHHNFSIFF